MASKKPTQAPTLDAGNMVKGGTPAAQKFPDWKQWVEGSSEFDGTGLRDVVFSNAQYLDDVKGDLDSLRGSTDHRIDILEAKVAALEAAPPSPFPG
jgi:hypothetical protein